MEGGGCFCSFSMLVGAALLAGALIYGMAMWRKRPKSLAAKRRREEAVRENYRRGG
jgi:hypothetical protein